MFKRLWWGRSHEEILQMQAAAQAAHDAVDTLLTTIVVDDYPRYRQRGLLYLAEQYSDVHAKSSGKPDVDGQSYRVYQKMEARYAKLAHDIRLVAQLLPDGTEA